MRGGVLSAAATTRRWSSEAARSGPGRGQFAAVLDALPDATAILDAGGDIIAVNKAWRMFGQENQGSSRGTGIGVNYLQVCDRAAATGCADAADVAAGLRAVLAGQQVASELEYPCDGDPHRWFISRITAIEAPGGGAVASHIDITRHRAQTRN